MTNKAEAIEFGDQVVQEEPVNLSARLERSLSLNYGKDAIVADGVAISYERLDDLTKHFARQITCCTDDQTLVPVMSKGGADYCVAILACIRAGRPFVPLDVAWPHDRLAGIVQRLDPALVVAAGDVPTVDTAKQFKTLSLKISGFSVDSSLTLERPEADQSPSPDALVYGFFTSGTTGQPKCALNMHRGLVNRIDYMTQQFGLGKTTLLNSSHVFDSSLWQILWPIMTGGKVVIPKRSGPLDIGGTIESIARWRVQMTDFVPSIFEALVHSVECDQVRKGDLLASLEVVIVGGEEANADVVRRFKDALPWVEVVNTYGPTEASIGSVFHRLGSQTVDRIPLGKPISNTFVAVVAPDRTIARKGTTGEIAVGGICLGRGYFQDEVKTAYVFRSVTSIEVKTNYPVYLTGDLGHMDDDGTLWFHGRLDDQLKVGGIRIEPGEIEHHLNRHASVFSSKVIGIEGIGGRCQIAAFYRASEPIDPEDLKAFLARSIPRESIPVILRRVDAFPLNHNGKADRKALAELIRQSPSQIRSSQALPTKRTQDDVLIKVLEAWRVCFDDTSLNENSDFFSIGGDSLTAVHLGLHLEELLFRKVSPEAIFSCRTPKQLTCLLCAKKEQGLEISTSINSDDAFIKDLDLFKRLRVAISSRQEAVRQVLVTGATGYVGAHVLGQLLSDRRFSVACLVRAGDTQQAASRVRSALATTGKHLEIPEDRLRALPADLGMKQFGLSKEDWDHLTNTVQAVVHMAAEVDFVKPYDSLRRVNVGGLRRVLEFNTVGRPKRLLFTSSVGAIGAEVSDKVVIPESLISRDWPRPDTGYDLSKWVCEAGLDPLFARGLPVKVFRLGEMMPPAQGKFNPRSLVTILLESCAVAGAFPAIDMTFDWTQVDHFAKVLVDNIDDPNFAPQVVNFRSPVSVSFEHLILLSGIADQLEPLSLKLFVQRLQETFKRFPERLAIGRAISLLERQKLEPDGHRKVKRQFCTATADSHLNTLSLKWETPNRVSHTRSINRILCSPDLTAARAFA